MTEYTKSLSFKYLKWALGTVMTHPRANTSCCSPTTNSPCPALSSHLHVYLHRTIKWSESRTSILCKCSQRLLQDMEVINTITLQKSNVLAYVVLNVSINITNLLVCSTKVRIWMNSCNTPQISYQHDRTDVSRNNVKSKMKPSTLL